MRALIDKLENGLKEEFKKRGFGWLIWGLTIGFIILNALLNIFFEKKKNIKIKEKKMDYSQKNSILQTDTIKKEDVTQKTDSASKDEITLTAILEKKAFAWSIFGISFTLMFIDNFLKMETLIGGWHIILYLLTLAPLVYLSLTNQTKNRYIKWFFPALLIMIFDMFYYNNSLVQTVVPIVFYTLVALLYITSMHNLHSLYQTLIPMFRWNFDIADNLIAFLSNIFVREEHKAIYGRIALALLITIPFLGVFVALLFSADSNFSNLIEKILSIDITFDSKYILTVPLYLFGYLTFYLYMFSNQKERTLKPKTQPLDMLIVGIFLGMINLLFITFISLQIPFLLNETYLTQGVSISEFAREGFFQLMMVMGIVLLIFLFIMRRFKGEKTISIMLTGLTIETILMGVVSLKKMYLYQSLKGATVMRYYVEWFDYFLLLILLLGIWFIIKKVAFSKLLNLTALFGVLSFVIISSLNVDGMVASNNIQKFKDKEDFLDRIALKKLSIDALPSLYHHNITLDNNQTNTSWYVESKRKNCEGGFSEYHWGYCNILTMYGEKK